MAPTRTLLSPEEVLDRYHGGPKTGVFTDGSCDPNPGPGGWGFVWVENDEIIRSDRGFEPDTTNNRMELRALIEAYKALPEDAECVLYSDSKICVDTVNQWAAGWESAAGNARAGRSRTSSWCRNSSPSRRPIHPLASNGSRRTTVRVGTNTWTRLRLRISANAFRPAFGAA